MRNFPSHHVGVRVPKPQCIMIRSIASHIYNHRRSSCSENKVASYLAVWLSGQDGAFLLDTPRLLPGQCCEPWLVRAAAAFRIAAYAMGAGNNREQIRWRTKLQLAPCRLSLPAALGHGSTSKWAEVGSISSIPVNPAHISFHSRAGGRAARLQGLFSLLHMLTDRQDAEAREGELPP
jgi:hypothetical protein